VAHFSGAHDAQGNPVKLRSVITQQRLSLSNTTWGTGLITSAVDAPCTATITVADNDFSTGAVELHLDDHLLVSGVHYAIGASATDTAHNLAAAITNLHGFNATHLLGVVSITGPVGPDGGTIELKVLHRGTILNVTYTPFVVGQPRLGPLSIA